MRMYGQTRKGKQDRVHGYWRDRTMGIATLSVILFSFIAPILLSVSCSDAVIALGVCKETESGILSNERFDVKRRYVMCGLGGDSRSYLIVRDKDDLFSRERTAMAVSPMYYADIESFRFIDSITVSVRLIREQDTSIILIDLSNSQTHFKFDYGT